MENNKIHCAALDRVNSYIERYSGEHKIVNDRFRPHYHLAAKIGWINDPNGFGYFNGKYHLFFQYNPYGSVWGPMHWGHAVSDDMVKWEILPVALAPSESYDDDLGCFSGSSLVAGGKLVLMYTGVGKDKKQQQCLAYSADGKNFVKYENNPVICAAQMPGGESIADFRDPYVYEREGRFYCLVGTRIGEYGNIAMFTSPDLTSWQFVGYAFEEGGNEYTSKGVCECPSRAVIGDTEVLFYSPQFMPYTGSKFRNIHSAAYIVGHFDYQTGKFIGGALHEIDSGFDFYAPQVIRLPDGRTAMTAWMQMWDRNIPTAQDGWSGEMVFTRELTLKDGKLCQSPVREIEKYRSDERKLDDLELCNCAVDVEEFSGDCSEIIFTLHKGTANRAGIELFKGPVHCTYLYYHAHSGRITLDRVRSGIDIRGNEGEEIYWQRSANAPEGDSITFRILLDNTSVEVFIEGTAETLTANIYADESDEGVAFFADSGTARITNARKYTIKI